MDAKPLLPGQTQLSGQILPYGYVQGGFFSGLERANEIAGCIQGEKCEPYEPSTGLYSNRENTGLQGEEQSVPDDSSPSMSLVGVLFHLFLIC